MANRYPLKHQADGDIQRFTRDEEHWLAYQASLRLMMDDSTAPYQLSTLSGNSIGSFTDTFFNEAVGTHPGSSITTGSTVTTVYQRTGSDLDSADANFRTPINVNNVAGKIAEFSQAEWGDLANRLAKIIMTNEYPGTFRLGSSAPSGDYSVHLNNVFSDTQTDGTTVNYSIYKRATMTAPTKVNAMAIKRSAGPTGIYQGVQAMDSDQMTYSFGNHLKTWMMSTANNVGAYQLRSSAQGAPVATGTWSTRGTATDTKKTTSDVDYTRNSTRNQDENFTSVYETDYIGDYEGNYIGDFLGDFTGNFTGDFVGTYIGNFVGDNAIDYTRNSIIDSTRNSTRSSTNVDGINYTRNSTIGYTGDFTGDFVGPPTNYTTTYFGTYTGYTSESPVQQIFTGNYIGDFLGPEGNFTTNYTRNSIAGFIGDYLGPQSFTGDFTGNYIGDFVGNYLGPQDFTRNQDENFTADSTRNSTANSTRTSTTNYAGNYVGTFTGDFIGTYTGDFTGNYLGETIQSSSETIETYTLYVRVA